MRAIAELLEAGGGDLSEEERAAFEQAMAAGKQLVQVMAERNVAAILDNDAGVLLEGPG